MSDERDGAERKANAVPQADEWRLIYGVLVLAAASLLAFTVRSVLSPILVYIVLVALLSPYVGTRRHLIVIIVSTLLLGFWLLATLGGLLAPFILALAIAYILDPAVDRLERLKIPRTLAIGILALPVLGLLAVLFIVGIPAAVDQIESLISQLPDAMRRLESTIAGWRARLGGSRIPLLGSFEAMLDPDRLGELIRQRQQRILEGGVAALLGVGRGVGAFFTILGYVVLTPILLFYLLRDFDRIKSRAAAQIPRPRQPAFLGFFREYDRLLARFLRGQLLAATIVGVLTWLGLMIIGFPYPGLVGLIAGVFNVVPYLGLAVSVIPVVIISLLSGSILGSLLKAGIVFAVVQFIDSSVTGPRIVGESVGLHPVWVILALAVGGFALGFVGLLIAMPAAVMIKLLVGIGLERYRASNVYQAGRAAEAEEG